MSAIRNGIVEYFRAISQTYFFEKPLFGAALLALLCAFSPWLFACGFGASLVGHFYATRYSTPKALKTWGLITINCFFFGLAMASLFERNMSFFVCLMIGAMAIPMVTKACYEVLQHWKLSPFIMPYIAMVWIILLAWHGSGAELSAAGWPYAFSPSATALHPAWPLGLRAFWAVFESMGRLLFLPNAWFGLAVFCLVTVFSLRRGVFFLLGTVVATAAALALAPHSTLWENGFFSYSGGLVGLGLASFVERYRWQTIMLFCILSSFLTMAAAQLLQGLHLPALSLPYVLTLWGAALSRVPRVSVSWAPEARSTARRAT